MIIVIAGIGIWTALMMCAVTVNEKAKSPRAKDIARFVMAGAVGLGAYFNGAPNKRERDYMRREKIKAKLSNKR